jgi:hypothetical protein
MRHWRRFRSRCCAIFLDPRPETRG